MERERVYESIDSERQYQEKRWGTVDERPHEVGAWMTLMRHHLAKAEALWCTSNGDDQALRELRKVIAVGVSCAEQHGLPGRSVHQTVESIRTT